MLNRNLASVEKQLRKFAYEIKTDTQENPVVNEVVIPTEFDHKMKELENEVAILKAQNPKPEERKAVVGQHARNLMGRRDGICTLTEAASMEFDFQSKSVQTSDPNQASIYRPGIPKFDGPTVNYGGARF
jgi:hypothetical protein